MDKQELLGFYVSDNYKMLAIKCVLIVWTSVSRVICFAPTEYQILVRVNVRETMTIVLLTDRLVT